jgi:hypothetical protein
MWWQWAWNVLPPPLLLLLLLLQGAAAGHGPYLALPKYAPQRDGLLQGPGSQVSPLWSFCFSYFIFLYYLIACIMMKPG